MMSLRGRTVEGRAPITQSVPKQSLSQWAGLGQACVGLLLTRRSHLQNRRRVRSVVPSGDWLCEVNC